MTNSRYRRICWRALRLVDFSFCFFVPILGAIFQNLRYVRNISEYIYRFHLPFINSLIICIFEFHNMRQYWKSVIMMQVYSVLLSVTNYRLAFSIYCIWWLHSWYTLCQSHYTGSVRLKFRTFCSVPACRPQLPQPCLLAWK